MNRRARLATIRAQRGASMQNYAWCRGASGQYAQADAAARPLHSYHRREPEPRRHHRGWPARGRASPGHGHPRRQRRRPRRSRRPCPTSSSSTSRTPSATRSSTSSRCRRALQRPIAMFVDRSDEAEIEAAVDAGVSAYVVDGLKKERVKPILDMAISPLQRLLRGCRANSTKRARRSRTARSSIRPRRS